MYVEGKKKTYKTGKQNRCKSLIINAEKEGFEPPVPVRVHLISSQVNTLFRRFSLLAFILLKYTVKLRFMSG